MNGLRTIVTALALLLAAAPAHAEGVAAKRGLTLEGAKQVIAAAAAEARRHKVGGAFAVVDEGGNLLALERLDGTFAASGQISIGKARTAAIFQHPTRAFEEIIRGGRTPMLALHDFTPLQGGVPIVVDGQVVGAIGVSGAASAQQDDELAMIGAAAARGFSAAASAAPAITYIERGAVAAAFARGMPLLEVDGYKIHASRREGPGLAEVHDWETDVVYVLEGSAIVVTGGTVVDGQVTEPGQVRGAAIRGGETRPIGKGDVVVIPAGVPHWFKEVSGPLTYFVVKPISMSGGAR
ncbi:MAG TPA: heme-binding protein [Verrucomicrobiae bacterium]|jgi:glc operon protein GlcG|nr:heme-binding protein [Verrucomicrobiae bacterium]